MKKIALILMLSAMSMFCYAQDIVKESTYEIELTKDALFTKVKMFIVDSWVNPKHSILNEDKENGIIQIKTDSEIAINVGMGLQSVYEYEYRTRIRMKDGKYKIEFYDVTCTSAEQVGLGNSYDIPEIPYFEGDEPPVKTTKMGKGVPAKKAVEIMNTLRKEFEIITNKLNEYLTSEDDF